MLIKWTNNSEQAQQPSPFVGGHNYFGLKYLKQIDIFDSNFYDSESKDPISQNAQP